MKEERDREKERHVEDYKKEDAEGDGRENYFMFINLILYLHLFMNCTRDSILKNEIMRYKIIPEVKILLTVHASLSFSFSMFSNLEFFSLLLLLDWFLMESLCLGI
eukprot:gnl/TRDRNA2_/TRDRNA2_177610_c5_seq1.p4 gnl/TRDRNA2_/TRDRNA2_177610_c5~~gnl/TRDRNA2_/TRDRNA2_177610_c5_seq1.p4  ORF type:complete len:106 (+),score=5.45 gnl/TRDRNA2_/TRDRNA2_177610_c5_seq1:101-418(+)